MRGETPPAPASKEVDAENLEGETIGLIENQSPAAVQKRNRAVV